MMKYWGAVLASATALVGSVKWSENSERYLAQAAKLSENPDRTFLRAILKDITGNREVTVVLNN